MEKLDLQQFTVHNMVSQHIWLISRFVWSIHLALISDAVRPIKLRKRKILNSLMNLRLTSSEVYTDPIYLISWFLTNTTKIPILQFYGPHCRTSSFLSDYILSSNDLKGVSVNPESRNGFLSGLGLSAISAQLESNGSWRILCSGSRGW